MAQFQTGNDRNSLLNEISISTIDLESSWNDISQLNRFNPVSDRLVTLLEQNAPSFALRTALLEVDFDEVQCFLNGVLIEEQINSVAVERIRRSSGFKGRFLWRLYQRGDNANDATDALIKKAKSQRQKWEPLVAGFFAGNLETAKRRTTLCTSLKFGYRSRVSLCS